MIDNLIAYTDDHMSLITAIVLLKRKFTVDEIIDNLLRIDKLEAAKVLDALHPSLFVLGHVILEALVLAEHLNVL
jgi:hypothetical protein